MLAFPIALDENMLHFSIQYLDSADEVTGQPLEQRNAV